MLTHRSHMATPTTEIVLNGYKIDSVASKLKFSIQVYLIPLNAIKLLLGIRPWHIIIMQTKKYLGMCWPVDVGLIELRGGETSDGLLSGARIFQELRRKK